MENERDRRFMELALNEARLAAGKGEVPIGAVVVRGDEVIAKGHNLRETGHNALCHAEIIAINEACKALGGWRLQDCELYVTLEPCAMCAGAVINSRIKRVVFAAKDEKAGACGTLINLFALNFNHRPSLQSGVMEQESVLLLQEFFKKLRNRS